MQHRDRKKLYNHRSIFKTYTTSRITYYLLKTFLEALSFILLKFIIRKENNNFIKNYIITDAY